MKKLYFLLFISALALSSCTKEVISPVDVDVNAFMRTHDRGTVAYVDYSTGNYIIETYGGYSVVESWGGVSPREYDIHYGYFSNRGVQNIYSRTGNYFTQGQVVDSWLTWSQALYVLDNLGY